MTALTNKPQLIVQTPESDFDALFLAHYDRVYGILYRLVGTRAEAEDLAQEVFLKLYQTPPRRGHGNIGAWLYRVATNVGYNHVRGRKRRWQWNMFLIRDDSAESPQTQLELDEDTATVRRALAQMPRKQGQLLMLRHMGLSYSELAAACDIKPASVGKQLSRATSKFRQIYLSETGERHV